MTTRTLHVERAEHNEALLGPLLTLGTHPDWCITTAFYAAVHWVRALLASHGWGSRAGEQIRYEEFPSYFDKLKAKGVALESLHSNFDGLKKLSLQSRYDCFPTNWYADRIEDARDYLAEIRAYVGRHWGS